MKRVFLDSSVLFSALYSSRGFSRDLLLTAARGEIVLVMRQDVADETKRNLAEHAPDTTRALWDYFLSNLAVEYVTPTKREVRAAAKRVVAKDAPIVAAARKANVDFLVTLDKKHLLGKPELAKYVRTDIVTPKEAAARLTRVN
ncbi:MAG: PIN domain-containing protein [Anaerolineae bacterium]